MKSQINMLLILFISSLFLLINCSWNNPYAPGWLADIIEEVVPPEPSPSSVGPRLLGATATGYKTVELNFDKNLTLTEAEDRNNYNIIDVTVDGAELLIDNSIVKLITSLQEDRQYTVTVDNVTDQTDGEVIQSPNNTASFSGFVFTSGYTADITVPLDYPTIQDAIDNALVGQVIYIQPGEYDEGMITINKRVILMGRVAGMIQYQAPLSGIQPRLQPMIYTP